MTSSNGLRVMAGILVKIQYRGIQDVCIPAVKIGEPCKKKISYAAKFIDDLILVMNIQYGGVREMYNSQLSLQDINHNDCLELFLLLTGGELY